jgi:uncharacterized protein YggE
LKLRDLNKIEQLQDVADKLNIAGLDLTNSTHTELTTFRRETKIEAIKAAKVKAQYMLNAIGENLGQAVFIEEIADDASDNRDALSNTRSNSIVLSTGIFGSTNQQDAQSTLSFSKIKIRYSVVAKFEIQ